jgi:hypothetical protein
VSEPDAGCRARGNSRSSLEMKTLGRPLFSCSSLRYAGRDPIARSAHHLIPRIVWSLKLQAAP